MELVKCEIYKKTVEKTYETIKRVQDALARIDMTQSSGMNLSFSFFGIFSYNGQIGVSMDTKGNVALQGSYGGGIGTGSSSLSFTSYNTITNAPHVSRLEGEWYQIGGSAGIPVYGFPLAVGGDFLIIPFYEDTDGDDIKEEVTQYFGVTRNIGVGTLGGEMHVEWGNTEPITKSDEPIQINIFDMIDDLYAKIME